MKITTLERTSLGARELLTEQGEVFAVFDATTQASGNVSYGALNSGERLFVKTAGARTNNEPLSYEARVALLRNAVRLARRISDPALPALLNVVESEEGPLLVYEWVEGELLRVPSARRSDPKSAFARFRALPAAEIVAALDEVFRLHVELARQGYVAGDYYDGCLIYDFAGRRMHVVDVDNYREGPFINEVGRMFGSTRFMAPEEHERGAPIDQRTTVFSLGRTVQELFPAAPVAVADVAAWACRLEPRERPQTVAQFHEAWSSAVRTTSA